MNSSVSPIAIAIATASTSFAAVAQYEFKNGDITYRVSDEGMLQVIRGRSKVLFEEQGKWD